MNKCASPTKGPRIIVRSSIILAVTSAFVAWAMAADPKASRLYEDALGRFEKKDNAGAIVQLKNVLQIDKTMLPAHVLLGKALLNSGDVIAAEVALTEALRLGVNRAEVILPLARALIDQGKQQQVLDQPHFAPAGLPPGLTQQVLLLRASAVTDLGDPRAALKLIEDARALEPSTPSTWLAEVPIRVRLRQLQDAKSAADKALALAPKSAEAHYQRGTVAHLMGDSQAALDLYGKALTLDPRHVEAHVSRAGLLLDLGRMSDAIKDIAILVQDWPEEPRARYLKALIDERQGDMAGSRAALNDVTALLDRVPIEFMRYRPQLLMLGGLAHYGLKEFEKARPYLEQVQRTQPLTGVSKLLAQIHLRDKNYDRAIESLDAYLKAFPNDSQAIHLLASAHMAQGRYARATQLTQDALRLRDQPVMRGLLGLSLIGSGKYLDAVKELEASLAKDPRQLQAGVALANIYLQGRQPARALKVAEVLYKHHSANAGVASLLGSARVAVGDVKGARASFEHAIKLDPAYATPQVELARLEATSGALPQAVDRLAAVLARDDKNADATLELGYILERSGRLADAQRAFERADDVSGQDNIQSGLILVDFLLRLGNPTAAQEALKRLNGKAPDAVPVLLAAARVNLAVGNPAGAKTLLTRAATTANYDAPALLQIALLQMQAGHVPGAAHSLDKALSQSPSLLPAHALMVDVEVRQGELAKAEQRARQITTQHPKLGIGFALLGDVASARGQRPAALENYRRAHQLEQSSESLLRLHRLLSTTDLEGATQLAEQWLKGHPSDLTVRRVVAEGHARGGRFAAARSAYESLLKLAPDDAVSLNNLAYVLIALKDPSALTVAEQALAKQPNVPNVLGTTGWAAFKAGQIDRALHLLRDARLRDPTNPETRFYLASVLASTGRKAEAREELESALNTGATFSSAKEAQELLRTLK